MLPDPTEPQIAAVVPSDVVASSAKEATLVSSETAPPPSLALEQGSTQSVDPSVAALVLPPISQPSPSVISEVNVAPASLPPSSQSPPAAVAVSHQALPQTQASVQVQQILQHSRPIDLTPSTPAARVIDEVVPPGHGVHDRQAMMNNLGVHPAVYQYAGPNGEEDGEARSPRELAYARGQPGARASPLVLDVLIGALSVLLAYAAIRRFL